MVKLNKILITGAAGFIGSHFARILSEKYPALKIVILDKLTYAGNLSNIEDCLQRPGIEFIKGDICDLQTVRKAMRDCNAVVNFAAETHVDRSIEECSPFIKTNYFGTYVLLEIAREMNIKSFIQISTDEVYGPIPEGAFNENDPLNPSNPYAATKAGADLLCLSYFKSYGLPVCITRSTNNYGPYQYPEKVVPLFIINALQNKPLPIYGDGKYYRDWLYVGDNGEAILLVLEKGVPGEIYNVGAQNYIENNQLAKLILDHLKKSWDLVVRVNDRPAHDKRYALDCSKIERLGWSPKTPFQDAFGKTIMWYLENENWWKE
ncbi:dTDP-glucose 4,6-dehydratase [bacterium]|nr:dTDP-glucose 4,6-dehydratase [bacterium]